MLLQFSVNNFKSIKDTVNFSMEVDSKDKNNFFELRKYKLLQTAVLYGANASGKSNFLEAMSFMRELVLNKYKIIQSTDKLPHKAFKLNSETENASSSFEIIFFIDEVKYRYGFETDDETVYSEWLYMDEKGKEAKLFHRDFDEADYVNQNKFKEGYDFFNKKKKKINILNNQLFIWKCDQNNGVISKKILKWFQNFNSINGLSTNNYTNYAMKQMENKEFRDEMISLVKTADIGIENIILEEKDIPKDFIQKSSLPDNLKEILLKSENLSSISLKTHHRKYDKDNNEIDITTFELNKDESIGTKNLFNISAPILNTLKEGKVLIIDEFGTSLHPMIIIHLIKLFHNEKINKKNAQLIFTTHDTNLLDNTIFRRDQIWFTEKDRYGSTDLFSLAQFNGVRPEEDFEKNYIQGKYGAIPYLGKFEFSSNG